MNPSASDTIHITLQEPAHSRGRHGLAHHWGDPGFDVVPLFRPGLDRQDLPGAPEDNGEEVRVSYHGLVDCKRLATVLGRFALSVLANARYSASAASPSVDSSPEASSCCSQSSECTDRCSASASRLAVRSSPHQLQNCAEILTNRFPPRRQTAPPPISMAQASPASPGACPPRLPR
jgi:hypothetical protein